MRNCPNCGINYEYFKKHGKLGCDQCYRVFRENLIPLIEQLHSSRLHAGKRPHVDNIRTNSIRHLSRLKLALDEAVRTEDYEKAAILRDKIKKIEEELKE